MSTEPSADATTGVPKKKKKLTAEEERRRRKKLKRKREERIKAGGADRIRFVQNVISKDELKQTETQNLSKSTTPPRPSQPSPPTSSTTTQQPTTSSYINHTNHTHINDAFNSNRNYPFGQSNPFDVNDNNNLNQMNNPLIDAMMRNMRANMNGLDDSMSSMDGVIPPIDPNMDMQSMLDQMMNGLLGPINGTTPPQTSEAILEKWKTEEKMKKYNKYSHIIFCLLFAILLVFIPYDISIFSYNLSSDTWTYFISFEFVLFSIFYVYQQRFQSKYNKQQNQQPKVDLMSILPAMMGGFGGGSGLIMKWWARAKMLWSYIKMIRQIISDLCLVIFLWIFLTSIKIVITTVFSIG